MSELIVCLRRYSRPEDELNADSFKVGRPRAPLRLGEQVGFVHL